MLRLNFGKQFLSGRTAWRRERSHSAAAALVVASLMDSSRPSHIILEAVLQFVARYYHLKNAEDPSAAAINKARAFDAAVARVRAGNTPRLDAEKYFIGAVQNRLVMIGDPVKDWLAA